mmetsp:Transcript_47899/g.158723  ORF Transcript_47899/g.158723 Transcript_47899/m.158723 type:complete len:226 (-) Transcript_47899:294-971(-)
MRVCRCSRPAGSRRRILPAPPPRCRSCWARCSSSPRTGLLAAGCLPAPPRSPSPCSAPAATPASAETSAEVLAACSRDPTAETQPPRLRRDVSRGAWRASPGFLVRGRSGAAVGGPRGGWPVGASCSASLARADPRPPQAGLRREWGGGRGGGSDRGARVRGRAAEEVEDGGGGGGGLPAGLMLVVSSGQLGSSAAISTQASWGSSSGDRARRLCSEAASLSAGH